MTAPCKLADNDRLNGIGASESPILMNGGAFGKSPATLFAVKAGIIEDDFKPTPGMLWGNRLESPIIDGLNEGHEFGHDVMVRECQRRLRSTSWPWMTCTPDAWVFERSMNAGWHVVGPLQIKTSKITYQWQDGVPRYVWCQLQHEMAVTGYSKGIALVFGPSASGPGLEPAWSWVERDEEFVEALVDATRVLWEGVQSGVMPPELLDGSEECRRILSRVYPEPVPDSEVQLPGEWVDVDEELQAAAADLEAARLTHEMLRNRLRHAMGENENALLPNGVRYTNRRTARGHRVLRRKEADHG